MTILLFIENANCKNSKNSGKYYEFLKEFLKWVLELVKLRDFPIFNCFECNLIVLISAHSAFIYNKSYANCVFRCQHETRQTFVILGLS